MIRLCLFVCLDLVGRIHIELKAPASKNLLHWLLWCLKNACCFSSQVDKATVCLSGETLQDRDWTILQPGTLGYHHKRKILLLEVRRICLTSSLEKIFSKLCFRLNSVKCGPSQQILMRHLTISMGTQTVSDIRFYSILFAIEGTNSQTVQIISLKGDARLAAAHENSCSH
jgi:hypothetical protein